MKDLHSLPKVRDSLTYLYVERCKVEQDQKAITLFDARGSVAVPCASITLLLLGPGTTVTHAAMRSLAENGCMVCWTGEGAVRLYAHSTGETRSARNLIRQAQLASDPTERLGVIDRMYRLRFDEEIPAGLSLQQLRGREGLRVRASYARASVETGVAWQGRFYDRGDWRRRAPAELVQHTGTEGAVGSGPGSRLGGSIRASALSRQNARQVDADHADCRHAPRPIGQEGRAGELSRPRPGLGLKSAGFH